MFSIVLCFVLGCLFLTIAFMLFCEACSVGGNSGLLFVVPLIFGSTLIFSGYIKADNIYWAKTYLTELETVPVVKVGEEYFIYNNDGGFSEKVGGPLIPTGVMKVLPKDKVKILVWKSRIDLKYKNYIYEIIRGDE